MILRFSSWTILLTICPTSITAFSPLPWTTSSQPQNVVVYRKHSGDATLSMGKRRGAFITETMTSKEDENMAEQAATSPHLESSIEASVEASVEQAVEAAVDAMEEEDRPSQLPPTPPPVSKVTKEKVDQMSESVDQLVSDVEDLISDVMSSIEQRAEAQVEAMVEGELDLSLLEQSAEASVQNDEEEEEEEDDDIGAFLDSYSQGEQVDEALLEAQAEKAGVNIANVEKKAEETVVAGLNVQELEETVEEEAEKQFPVVSDAEAEETVSIPDFQSELEAKAEALGVKVAEKLNIMPQLEMTSEATVESKVEEESVPAQEVSQEEEESATTSGGEAGSLVSMEDISKQHEMIQEILGNAEPASSIHGPYPPNLKCKTYQEKPRVRKGIIVLEFNDRPE